MSSEIDKLPNSCRLSSLDIVCDFATHSRRLGQFTNLCATMSQKFWTLIFHVFNGELCGSIIVGSSFRSITSCLRFVSF